MGDWPTGSEDPGSPPLITMQSVSGTFPELVPRKEVGNHC